MSAAIRILGLSGSLRSGSHNTALLRAAAKSLPSGAELEVYDGLRDLPAYDADLDTPETEPETVAQLRRAIASRRRATVSGSVSGVSRSAS